MCGCRCRCLIWYSVGPGSPYNTIRTCSLDGTYLGFFWFFFLLPLFCFSLIMIIVLAPPPKSVVSLPILNATNVPIICSGPPWEMVTTRPTCYRQHSVSPAQCTLIRAIQPARISFLKSYAHVAQVYDGSFKTQLPPATSNRDGKGIPVHSLPKDASLFKIYIYIFQRLILPQLSPSFSSPLQGPWSVQLHK